MATVAPVPAFSLSLSPASVRLVSVQAQQGYLGSVKVTDTGTKPVRVTMSAVRMPATGAHCATGQGPVPWIQLAGSQGFTLKSGQSRTVGYSVHASPADTGQSAAVVASANAISRHGVTVSAAVGSRVYLGQAGTCHATAAAPPAGNSSGISPLTGGAVAAAVVAAAVITVLRVRHNRRRRAAL